MIVAPGVGIEIDRVHELSLLLHLLSEIVGGGAVTGFGDDLSCFCEITLKKVRKAGGKGVLISGLIGCVDKAYVDRCIDGVCETISAAFVKSPSKIG